MVRRIAILIMGIGVFLSSCSQETIQASPTSIPTGMLTPYYTVTPSPIQASATIKVTIPVTPSPTATPFLYAVKGDDTMLSIAYQFGISLEELQGANPKVDPHFMGVGLKLIIPIRGETVEVLSTPTPMPVQAGQPKCYPAGDGGAWCIVTLTNELQTSLENLSVWIGIYNTGGEIITSQVAFAPLNILRPGSKMPMMAYFAPPLPDEFKALSEVLSGLAVAVNDKRYLDLKFDVGKVEINQTGEQAVINGDVSVPGAIPTLSQIWALAVAYDANGDIVGARKWKSEGETHFDITVYSLVGKIDHVDVLIEARP
jgi:LysM repeat protein